MWRHDESIDDLRDLVDSDRIVCSFINSIVIPSGSASSSNKPILLAKSAGGFRIHPAIPIASRRANGPCTLSFPHSSPGRAGDHAVRVMGGISPVARRMC